MHIRVYTHTVHTCARVSAASTCVCILRDTRTERHPHTVACSVDGACVNTNVSHPRSPPINPFPPRSCFTYRWDAGLFARSRNSQANKGRGTLNDPTRFFTTLVISPPRERRELSHRSDSSLLVDEAPAGAPDSRRGTFLALGTSLLFSRCFTPHLHNTLSFSRHFLINARAASYFYID